MSHNSGYIPIKSKMNLNQYPVQPTDELPELIVCSANKDPDNQVIYPCIRHGCEIFWGLIDKLNPDQDCNNFEQGFLTNKYRFVDREEAYQIALVNNQIKRLCPTGSSREYPELFSEMLY